MFDTVRERCEREKRHAAVIDSDPVVPYATEYVESQPLGKASLIVFCDFIEVELLLSWFDKARVHSGLPYREMCVAEIVLHCLAALHGKRVYMWFKDSALCRNTLIGGRYAI